MSYLDILTLVKTRPPWWSGGQESAFHVGDAGSVSGWGPKTPHTTAKPLLHTTEPVRPEPTIHNNEAHAPQQKACA